MPAPPLSHTGVKRGDWAWAQLAYEGPQALSTRQIAEAISMSQTAVVARASRYGWQRYKADAVVQDTARLVVAEATKLAMSKDSQKKLEIIERINVEAQAKLLYQHRTDIDKAKKATMALWTELKDDEEQLGLATKSKIVGNLAAAMKTFIQLERQAFGITGALEDPEAPPADPTAVNRGMDTILAKFSMVLSRTAPSGVGSVNGEVINMETTQ